MAVSPPSGYPLNMEQRAQANDVDELIEQALRAKEPRPSSLMVTLPSLPTPAVQRVVSYWYLAMGWGEVIFHKRAGSETATVELREEARQIA